MNYIGEKFRIPYPKSKAGQKQWSKEYGMNKYYAGCHWSIRKRDAEFWHNMVRICMEQQGVRRKPFERPVIISFYFNDRLDCSNHGVMIKMIEDGMKGRMICDDSRRFVKGIECYFHSEDYILVEVREVEHALD